MREIPEGLARGPFTVAMGRELGLTDEVLSGRRFRAPWTGVRVMAEAPDTLVERCRAAVLALPADAVFSHDTAVALGAGSSQRTGADRRPRTGHSSLTRGHPSTSRSLPWRVGRGGGDSSDTGPTWRPAT